MLKLPEAGEERKKSERGKRENERVPSVLDDLKKKTSGIYTTLLFYK